MSEKIESPQHKYNAYKVDFCKERYKRYEVRFTKGQDDKYIAYIEQMKADGKSVNELFTSIIKWYIDNEA